MFSINLPRLVAIIIDDLMIHWLVLFFVSSSSRLMRNLAEKMRRDKLNMYISELSSLVPIVAMATKRMDKTSVLRLSANFLRIHLSKLI
jgi:hypothetical protein